tara:strand:+ start:473 stop:1027 length:555 start_codon:yes stop_codon:yes gene_type:complete
MLLDKLNNKMVTLLQSGFEGLILPVVGFLLIYAILFAVLQKSKFFGGNMNTDIWIAFAISIIFALTPGALDFIRVVAPWFVVTMVIAFSFVLVFLFMGVSTESLTNVAKGPIVVWTIIILGVIIVIAGLTSVFGPILGQPSAVGGGAGREIQRSIFNTKILGLAFILLVASQAIRLISSDITKS